MIKIITGLPGSGKTYYAIHHLLQKHFHNLEGQWYKKPGVTIITDIEDLKIEHLNLRDVIRASGLKAEKFFTVEYQEKILKKYGYLVYIIDEAQRIFHRKFYDKDTFYFFDYHRHLGIDIYLIVQSFWKLPLEIRSVAETEIRAVRKSLSIFGEFKYSSRIDDDILERIVLKPDKTIFALYTSFKAEGREKSKSRIKLVTGIAILCVPIGLFVFFNWYGSSKNKNKKEEIVVVAQAQKQEIEIKENEKISKNNWVSITGWAGTEIDGNLIIKAYEYNGNVYKTGFHPMRKKGRDVQILVEEMEKLEKKEENEKGEGGALPRAQAPGSPGEGLEGARDGRKNPEVERPVGARVRAFKRVQMGEGEGKKEKG